MHSTLTFLLFALISILLISSSNASTPTPYKRHLFQRSKSNQIIHITPSSRPTLLASSLSSVKRSGSQQQQPKSTLLSPPATKAPVSAFKQVPPILAAAFVCAAVMYPVDLLRSLQMANVGSGKSTGQLVGDFYANFGAKGFFTQGLVPEVTRATWMRGLKFSIFPIVHEVAFRKPSSKGNPKSLAVAAILTSIPEVLTIMPLECSKIMLTLDTQKKFGNSMLKAMSEVYNTQGLSGFLTGYTGIQYRQAAWGAGYFASQPYFRRSTVRQLNALGYTDIESSKGGKMFVDLVSGFEAGVFGAIFNTPGDTIRSVVQKRIFNEVQTGVSSGLPTTFLTVGQQIVQDRGVTALWAGFGFKAVHLGGGGALMAFLIPVFKNLM